MRRRALACLAVLPALAAGPRPGAVTLAADAIAPARPDAALARALFGVEGPVTLAREADTPPNWLVAGPDGPFGHIASTWEIAGSVGYSGRPIPIFVAVTPEARIVGARLMRQNEPVLTPGISGADIATCVDAVSGFDLTGPAVSAFEPRAGLPEMVARATVSTGLIRDAILRTARTVALGRNLLGRQSHTRAVGARGPRDAAILVASRGAHSHRGLGWRRTGVFDRIEVIRGQQTIALTEDDFPRIDALAAEGAPAFREISVLRLNGVRFDPARPFRIEVSAARPAEGGGEVSTLLPLAYELPAEFLLPPEAPAGPEPAWVAASEEKGLELAGIGAMLAVLTAILCPQEGLVLRPGRGAVATSVPGALALPGGSRHLLAPAKGRCPRLWRGVTVVVPEAETADALSTAFAVSGCTRIGDLVPDGIGVIATDMAGRVHRFGRRLREA